MTPKLNRYRGNITARALAGDSLTAIAGTYNCTSAGISMALKRWGVKVPPRPHAVGRPIGSATHTITIPQYPMAALPVLPSGFIRPLTKAELMGGKSYGR